MAWEIYKGDGGTRDYAPPDAPPWRQFPIQGRDPGGNDTFVPTEEIIRAVNAAIYLRRPLLVTGPPGSGKSSIADSVARELRLGPVLRWHVTSHSTLEQAVYQYDALGRLQESQLHPDQAADVTRFLRLGALGTALLAAGEPRVLLIDELDKGELDLPGDLLNVLERGEYEIPELSRLGEQTVPIRVADRADDTRDITGGRIRCSVFPIIVMTSNGERAFPGPFLRRCIRVDIGLPDKDHLIEIVREHFTEPGIADQAADLIRAFAERIHPQSGRAARLAVDQLLNAVFLVTRRNAPEDEERERLVELIQRELDSA